MSPRAPLLRQVVIDTPNARRAAEFYRELLGLHYRPGDEPPPPGEPDPNGADYLALRGAGLAFQQVDGLPAPTWPGTHQPDDVPPGQPVPHPQMLHLDLTVPDRASLEEQHRRALALGARLLLDRTDDPEEPLRVYADLDGHPFCLFVAPPPEADEGPP